MTKNNPSNLEEIIFKSVSQTRVITARFGRVTRFHEDTGEIWVDYEDNPYQHPIKATVGVSHIKAPELQEAIDRSLEVKISFNEGHLNCPVIIDIVFSITERNRDQNENTRPRKMRIEADEIEFVARRKIKFICGQTKTSYNASNGQLITHAKSIWSFATRDIAIKGASIKLN